MKRLLVISLFVLSGCGSGDSSNNNHGYGWEYDVQGASGLTLRYHPEIPQVPVHLFEALYEEVQICTGLTAPGPFVIFTLFPAPPDPEIGLIAGYYHSDPPLIAIRVWGIFKHEAIHYLLDHNTGNFDPGHGSSLFAKCS